MAIEDDLAEISFEDEITFEGELFGAGTIACDTRDGELVFVLEQRGQDVDVRWFSEPLKIATCNVDDLAHLDDKKLACVGFVTETASDDQAHMAKAFRQLTALANALPADLRDFLQKRIAG